MKSTRREILTGTAAAVASISLIATKEASAATEDPFLPVYHTWQEANAEATQTTRARNAATLEVQELMGTPVPMIPRGGHVFRNIFDDNDIVQDTQPNMILPEDVALKRRAALRQKLAAVKARWKAEEAARGYRQLCDAEDQAGHREGELCNQVLSTPATTPAGAAAKLRVAIEYENTELAESDDYPWPFIRAALEDLERMAREA